MSPEQARGEAASSASDIFALGVVLYELTTGTHPFESPTTLGTLHAIATRATPRPGEGVIKVPTVLERLLLRMLVKEPAQRPSAGEVEAELTRLATALDERVHIDPWGGRRSQSSTTLPPQRTALVGRANELTAVKGILLDPDTRLLTLTGPGGTGKTRLAAQVAADFAEIFEGGSAFVNLAPIVDPSLVASAVAQAIGVRESADHALVAAITEHLRNSGSTLLVLDNFEQVSEAAGLVRELLDACPALKVLVTSRVVLHIYGEQEFPVPPLSLPERSSSSPAELLEYASIALFVQRAAASRPDFALTAKNAEYVAAICRRLDGLPLAIELAAARVKILPPADLLARLERGLEILTGGARDLPERQQTLRGAIKWSYDLLTPAEQRLFRRLSVFAGGCTLEAAEAVCDASEDLGIDVLLGVSALVDNSLLVQRSSDDGDPRFHMLETFREYGRERLRDSGETAPTQRAHAAYMLVLAEEENTEMNPAQRELWLRACDGEHDNFRVAMATLIAAGDVEWAMRLAAALFRFWEQRDHLTEGRETLARVLAMPEASAPTRPRARALYAAAVFTDIQGDSLGAETFSREACAIYHQLGDINGMAAAMTAVALQAQRQGRYADSTALFGETVELWQQVGNSTAVDLARSNMANAAKAEGNFPLAQALLEQVAAACLARHDVRGVASALNGLGDVAAARGELPAAHRYHHQSLEKFSQVNDQWGRARVLSDLAQLHIDARDHEAATGLLKESLQAYRSLGHQRGIARQLESLALCAGGQARDEEAVTLASAAAAIRTKIGMPHKPAERVRFDQALGLARSRLSKDDYEKAWDAGRSVSLDRILGMGVAAGPRTQA